MRRRLSSHRRVGLHLRRPACHLARRPLPDLCRPTARPNSTTTAGSSRAHHAGARRARSNGAISGPPSACAAPRERPVRTESTCSFAADHSITRNFEQECRESGPLYRMSAQAPAIRLGFSGVALGIARACARQLRRRGEKQDPVRPEEPDRATMRWCRSNLAQVEVGIRAPRAASCCRPWPRSGRSCQPGRQITIEQRITIRMASTNAIHQAREAVDFAYNAAGATAIFENHPLERRFRDIRTVTQQVQGRPQPFRNRRRLDDGRRRRPQACLEHDPEKWIPVFRKDHAPKKDERRTRMPLGTLQHYTIEPSDLERTKEFLLRRPGTGERRAATARIFRAIGSIPAASPPCT